MRTLEKDEAKRSVSHLVESFDRDLATIKKGTAGLEANVEDNYIKPLFAALNWNIHNEGLDHARQEWIVQYQLKRAGGRPDYLLRVWDESITRMRHVLIMEAKHPKYDIVRDARWISQAYLYAYSTLSRAERPERRVPLSLLTDFEEFRLFDCRDPEPLKTRDDPVPFNKRVIKGFDIKYTDYVDRFDDLWATFERSKVAQGSLGQWRLSDQNLKDARIPPDVAFLATLRGWRLELARSMYRNDKTLTEDILTSASQLYVNRLVFLKMLADKGIEEAYLDQLLARVSAAKTEEISFHQACSDIFASLDGLYNGSIFGQRVELDSVKVDNKVLKSILESIRPEKAIYSLDAMPVNVVGTMYEEFLGEVIRKQGKGITAEQKPEVRKAGGVYYTPQYIVDYIVEQTVAKLLADCKTPEEVAKLRICDPACGSGSFLLGVYDRLVSWHLDWFKAKVDEALAKGQALAAIQKKYRDAIHLIATDGGRSSYLLSLNIKLRRDILTNSVYGVDIDEQAVEVTRFSLSMKAVEGFRDRDELYADVDLFKTTVLPTLDGNIKCGNSLVGEDWFERQSLSIEDELRERRSLKPFDWRKEFPLVFGKGGFDAIVGNPPYGATLAETSRAYLQTKYKSYEYQLNSFSLFIERSLQQLKAFGKIGYIIPAVILNQHYFSKIRSVILTESAINILFLLGYRVFADAETGDTLILIARIEDARKNVVNCLSASELAQFPKPSSTQVEQHEFLGNDRHCLNFGSADEIMSKLSVSATPLGDISTCVMGIKPYQTGKGKPKQTKTIVQSRPFDVDHIIDTTYKQYIVGKDITRYSIVPKEPCYLKYGIWLAEPRPAAPFERVKIVCRQTSDCIVAAVDTSFYYNLNNVYNIEITKDTISIYYIIAILNSKLLKYAYFKIVGEKGRTFAEVKKVNLDRLPIKISSEKAFAEDIADKAKKLTNLQVLISGARTESDKKLYSSMADKLDREIDALVYQLYGLTEEEIAIVEEATK